LNFASNGHQLSKNDSTSNFNSSLPTNNNTNNTNSTQQQQISMLKQEHLLNCLAELFYSIVTMKKKKGIVQPKKFITRLRKDNESFDNLFQQDAHEFLNYLLNTCADILKEEMKEIKRLEEIHLKIPENYLSLNGSLSGSRTNSGSKFSLKAAQRVLNGSNSQNNAKQNGSLKDKDMNSLNSNNNKNDNNLQTSIDRNSSKNSSNRSTSSKNSTNSSSKIIDNSNNQTTTNNSKNQRENKTEEEESTWIHELFQGILVNETKCLNCETVS
jgi:hypothetical protein